MIDLENREQMLAYLKNKQVINDQDGYRVDYCRGGVSCVSALIEIPGKTLLVKQGREKLAVKEEWLADPGRMAIEARANDFYHTCIPESAPAVLFYDEENCVLLRDAAPAGCRMWKEDLLDGILDFGIAAKTMEALATVHNRSAGKEDIKKDFSDYSIFYQLRISPYIEFLVTKYPELSETAKGMIKRMEQNKRVIVHADYSPKNILVLPDRSICILDYEIAHYGDPAFDVAFYTNHIVLKSAHLTHMSGAFLNMLLHMTGTYFGMVDFMEPAALEAQCMDMLAVLMLARIDGKSPVEYIVSEQTKVLVRNMAFQLLRRKITGYKDAVALFWELESTASHTAGFRPALNGA